MSSTWRQVPRAGAIRARRQVECREWDARTVCLLALGLLAASATASDRPRPGLEPRIIDPPRLLVPQGRLDLAGLQRRMRARIDTLPGQANAEPLWRSVRNVLETELRGEWQAGRLVGTRPEQAFFARCDRSTMTDADIRAGRLVCLFGVAALKPAEFDIHRLERQVAPGVP
jgi:hypothetical protein